MIDDERDAVVRLLERKVDASGPRDPDPVRTVVRRARARRRRVIAAACGVVLGLAGIGAAGQLVMGEDTTRTSTPADNGRPTVPTPDLAGATNLREVTPWSGQTVAFHGLTVPVLPGWTVRRAANPQEVTCVGSEPRTLWLLEVPETGGVPGCFTTDEDRDLAWVVTDPGGSGLTAGGPNPLALDPSGQPVWLPSLPTAPGMSFPWLGVRIGARGVSDDDLLRMLSAVRADPVAPIPGLHVPERVEHVDYAGYQRFGGTSRSAPKPNGRPDERVVVDVLHTAVPDDTLRCIPKVGAILHLQAPEAVKAGPPYLMTYVFDTTGSCDQVTDNRGGLATLDDAGLRTLSEQVLAPG